MEAPFLGRRPAGPSGPWAVPSAASSAAPAASGDACAVDGDTRTELADSDTAVRHRSDTSGLRTVGAE